MALSKKFLGKKEILKKTPKEEKESNGDTLEEYEIEVDKAVVKVEIKKDENDSII